MERAFVMHTHRNHKHILVGDALLSRVFRQMGTLDSDCIEFLSITAENIIKEVEGLDSPIISMIEQGPASRNAWIGALSFCGIENTDDLSISIAHQRKPSISMINELTKNDRELRDSIMTLMTYSSSRY